MYTDQQRIKATIEYLRRKDDYDRTDRWEHIQQEIRDSYELLDENSWQCTWNDGSGDIEHIFNENMVADFLN